MHYATTTVTVDIIERARNINEQAAEENVVVIVVVAMISDQER